MTGPGPDPDLAALADEFGGWEFTWWDTGTGRKVLGRRRPVTVWSEWVIRDTPQEVGAEIRHREQNPPGG